MRGRKLLSNRLKKKESLAVLEVMITLTKKKECKNNMIDGLSSSFLI